MSLPLQNETSVLGAVHRLVAAGPAGCDTGKAMASLILETSGIDLTSLDAWERTLRAALWETKNASSGSPWKFWSRRAPFASWLDLCSGDGFRRERILRSATGGAPNGFFFSLALRRLNDWVPQVRSAAREHLPDIAKRSDPQHVADALWNSLGHWTSWGRMETTDRQILMALVGMERVSLAIKSRILQAAAGPATSVLSQVGRTPIFDKWLGEFATSAIQPSVRAKAYRCLLEARMTWVAGQRWTWTDVKWCKGRVEPIVEERSIQGVAPFPATLKMALVDRSPLVRRIAADHFMLRMDSIGPDAPGFARQLASDPSPYVAGRGRFILTKLGTRHETPS